jgi:squalene-hopene/tetraprenyl-beta-curcumene cyclase
VKPLVLIVSARARLRCPALNLLSVTRTGPPKCSPGRFIQALGQFVKIVFPPLGDRARIPGMRTTPTNLAIARALRVSLLIVLTSVPGLAGDWSPKLAAQYLDSRQKEWFAWPPAKRPGGPCISCHTGLTYMLARPELRRVLGEAEPTVYETGLVNGLLARVGIRLDDVLKAVKEPLASQSVGVEAIFAALFLGPEKPAAQQAWDRLWSMQFHEGAAKGSWPWFEFDTDPYETADAGFFGASLAALAISATPSEYRERPEIKERVAELTAYLRTETRAETRTATPAQPLHNRLLLLWAAAKLPAAIGDAKQSIIDETLQKQQRDGSWTIAALGPWKDHPTAPPANGASAYATAVAAFALEQAGVPRTDPKLKKALDWLRLKQDPQFGYWAADSMNKRREPGSMPEGFMRDAATAFAVLALIDPAPAGR